eukprot:Colp12_sorted_trinity150504_noHs@22058
MANAAELKRKYIAEACRRGGLQELKGYVSKLFGYEEVNFSYQGMAPIYIAAQEGHDHLIPFLLKAGASPNWTSYIDTSPLFIAAYKGHAKVITALLQSPLSRLMVNSGYCPDDWTAMLMMRDPEACHFLSVVGFSPLLAACYNGHVAAAVALLEGGANVNFTPTKKDTRFNSENIGLTALHIACKKGNAELVGHLLRAGASIDALAENYTPLVYAVGSGNLAVVSALISAGANVSLGNPSPLAMAMTGSPAIVNALIAAGADVCAYPYGSSPPIALAVSAKNVAVVNTLLAAGADIHVIMPPENLSLLHIAAGTGSAAITEILLRAGARADLKNKRGAEPLVMACVRDDSAEVVRLLLDAGSSPNTRFEDTSVLELAVAQRRTAIAEVLLHRGADVNGKAKDKNSTCLHYAVELDSPDLIRLLLAHGADTEAKTTGKDSMSPLELGVNTSKVDAVKVLAPHCKPQALRQALGTAQALRNVKVRDGMLACLQAALDQHRQQVQVDARPAATTQPLPVSSLTTEASPMSSAAEDTQVVATRDTNLIPGLLVSAAVGLTALVLSRVLG